MEEPLRIWLFQSLITFIDVSLGRNHLVREYDLVEAIPHKGLTAERIPTFGGYVSTAPFTTHRTSLVLYLKKINDMY